jgi:hypothetical protein
MVQARIHTFFGNLLKNDNVGFNPPKVPAGTIGFSASLRLKASAGVGSAAAALTMAGEGVLTPKEALPATSLILSYLPTPKLLLGDISDERSAPSLILSPWLTAVASQILSTLPPPNLGILGSILGETSSGVKTSFNCW